MSHRAAWLVGCEDNKHLISLYYIRMSYNMLRALSFPSFFFFFLKESKNNLSAQHRNALADVSRV